MKHFEPRVTYQFLKRTPDAVLIDCRSETQWRFEGLPWEQS